MAPGTYWVPRRAEFSLAPTDGVGCPVGGGDVSADRSGRGRLGGRYEIERSHCFGRNPDGWPHVHLLDPSESRILCLSPQCLSADGGGRPVGEETFQRTVLTGRTSEFDPRSRELTLSAGLLMAPGTYWIPRRAKSSLLLTSASARMEGDIRPGEETSWRTDRSGWSCLGGRSRVGMDRGQK